MLKLNSAVHAGFLGGGAPNGRARTPFIPDLLPMKRHTHLKRVLLVDEDRAFRECLARALRAREVEVEEAGDFDAARSALAKGQAEGVVFDLWCAGALELDFIHELRRAHATLPIVVLTGFGSIATAIESVRLGATDYLTKPADAESVLAALRGNSRMRGGGSEPSPAVVPSLDRVEWDHIQRVLATTGGNISEAARLLGLNRRSLQRKLGKHPPMR